MDDQLPGPVIDRGLRDAFWLLRKRLRGQRIEHPSCRRCGYPAIGVQSDSCPECGGQYKKNGIIAPANVRHVPRIVFRLFIWTMLVVPWALLLQPFVEEHVLPEKYDALTRDLEFKPNDESFYELEISADFPPFIDWRWFIEERQPTKVHLQLKSSDWSQRSDIVLGIDLVTGNYKFPDNLWVNEQPPTTGDDLDHAVIQEWFVANHIQSGESLADQSADIMNLLQIAMQSNNESFISTMEDAPLIAMRSSGTSGARWESHIIPWSRWTVIGTWILVWLIVAIRIAFVVRPVKVGK